MSAEIPSGSPQPQVVRVAVIGGGCAGMATAWQLSQLNQQRQARVRHLAAARAADDPDAAATIERELDDWPIYRIDVYEADVKLGGKGASTRDEADGRILEHGLHVWLGFYENAFRVMREVYDAAAEMGFGPDAPDGKRLVFGRFDDAFRPEPHIGVASRTGTDRTDVWSGYLPPMNGDPGTPLDEASNPYTWWGYGARALALVKALLLSTVAGADARQPRSALDEEAELDFSPDASASPAALVERLARLLRVGALGTAAGLLQAVTLLENWMRDGNPSPQLAPRLFRFIEALVTQTRRQLRDLVGIDEPLRRKTEVLDLVMTIMVGLWRDRVYFSRDGLDAIDHIDYRDWLRKHGATRGAVDSPLITGIYDLVFGYADGRHDRPSLSAGQAIRGAVRMFFTYRGSMFWRLNAGMGDVVFAPMVRVLSARGVGFHFAHALAGIGFADGDDPKAAGASDRRDGHLRVQSLTFHVAGAFTERGGLDARGCWPEAPSSELRRLMRDPAGALHLLELKAGGSPADGDFDAVVFAQGIDAFAWACGERAAPDAPPTSPFFQRRPRFEAMRQRVRTVATRSAQVWFDQPLHQLGWQRGTVIVAGMGVDGTAVADRGYETWADMGHLLHQEDRAASGQALQAQSLAYFCGVAPAGAALAAVAPADAAAFNAAGAEQAMREGAEAALARLLDKGMAPYWPGGGAEGTDAPAARWKPVSQHHSLNAVGSARYTQALPGSGTARISPLDPWCDNATLAGDWTDAGFNGGCVETAVMSGLLAAHAISGRVDLNALVGYHHP